jgi:hypothetical protein
MSKAPNPTTLHHQAVERLLTNIANQLKENHNATMQAMQSQLTVTTTMNAAITELQRQGINNTLVTARSTIITQDDERKRNAEIISSIERERISGGTNWTKHLETANEALKWGSPEDRYTLAILLNEDDGEADLLVWLLTFLTGMLQAYMLLTFYTGERQAVVESFIEEPVTGLISSDIAFQRIWRELILRYRLNESVVRAIKDRMIEYALDRYAKQKNTKQGSELTATDKHSKVTSFKAKYSDIFLVWTAQLLRDPIEREAYVLRLQQRADE